MDTRSPLRFRPDLAGRNLPKKIILVTSLIVACSWYIILARTQGTHHLSASTLADGVMAKEPLEKIKDTLAKRDFHNTTEFLDHVMGLTNRHTIHLADSWHDRNWDNQDLVLAHLYRAMSGDKAARPHASCGPRCMIMAWILQSYGIQSRQVAIFSSKYSERIVGHQQIEILNPDSGRWELYDPTWNVHFVDERSGERVAALDLYFRPVKPGKDGQDVIDGIVPCNHDGSSQGWDALYPFTKEELVPIANFADYGAIMYYCYQTRCPNEILVNVNRFHVNKRWDYPKLGLLQTTFEGYCRDVYPNHFMHFLDGPPPDLLKERLDHPAWVPTY